MDKNTIVQAIIGLITTGVIGAVSMLFSTIRELEFDNKMRSVRIDYLEKSDVKQWEFIDERLRRDVEEAKEEMEYRVEIEKRICNE